MESQKKVNPAPLGLLGFGMTTVLLNLHNAGVLPLSAVILAMGVFVGGIAQVIAGLLEFKHNNNFGGTAFTAYGCFWLSLVAIWWNPFGTTLPADEASMGFYLLLWGVFTLFMFVGTFKHNTISKIIFGTLTLLFFLLAIGDFTHISEVKVVAGIVGIFCGLSAIYSAVGQIVNEEFGKKVFPL